MRVIVARLRGDAEFRRDAVDLRQFLAADVAIRRGNRVQRFQQLLLPQVSFTWAIVEPVTWVGGMVNSPPRALMRS